MKTDEEYIKYMNLMDRVDLSKHLDISTQYLSNLITGKRRLTPLLKSKVDKVYRTENKIYRLVADIDSKEKYDLITKLVGMSYNELKEICKSI